MMRHFRTFRRCLGLAPALLLAAPLALAAQTVLPEPAPSLPLKRELPPVEWTGCAVPDAPAPAPTAEDRAEAARLAAEATEALILGDNQAALAALASAGTLDPRSERVAYLRARSLELLGRGEEALTEYCRYLALAPAGGESAEVTRRVDILVAARPFTVPAAAAAAYTQGIDHFDAGRAEQAHAAFDAAAAAAPAWASALYNRGLARLALGETAEATRDLRRYLELSPGAADLGLVLDVLGSFAGARPVYNPSSALAAGLVFPGLGHFTTGRPGRGAAFLAGAASLAGAGMLVTGSRVECLSPPVDGQCPPDQVLRETTTRPLLLPALLGALATGVAGAIDAYRGVARSNTNTDGRRSARDSSGFTAGPASMGIMPDGTRLTLVRLRF